MKRHPALEQLSRDHHHALVVAQRLKRAEPATASNAASEFLAYWNAHGRAHFRQEEEILLPSCVPFIDPGEPIVTRVLSDHVRIRRLADEVAGVPPLPLSLLHELGSQLEQHVRREERELFPRIEESLPDLELRRLIALLGR